MALSFSLLGAIGHFSKLLYLMAAFVLVWGGLSLADNRNLHLAGKGALTNVAHVVAVGQGHSYPINEAIRIHLLKGMEYGYHPK